MPMTRQDTLVGPLTAMEAARQVSTVLATKHPVPPSLAPASPAPLHMDLVVETLTLGYPVPVLLTQVPRDRVVPQCLILVRHVVTLTDVQLVREITTYLQVREVLLPQFLRQVVRPKLLRLTFNSLLFRTVDDAATFIVPGDIPTVQALLLPLLKP